MDLGLSSNVGAAAIFPPSVDQICFLTFTIATISWNARIGPTVRYQTTCSYWDSHERKFLKVAGRLNVHLKILLTLTGWSPVSDCLPPSIQNPSPTTPLSSSTCTTWPVTSSCRPGWFVTSFPSGDVMLGRWLTLERMVIGELHSGGLEWSLRWVTDMATWLLGVCPGPPATTTWQRCWFSSVAYIAIKVMNAISAHKTVQTKSYIGSLDNKDNTRVDTGDNT